MKKKSMLIVAIILMSIGFAAISTTLVINGNVRVSENTDDFSVIFTAASLDGKDVYSTVVDSTKKIITFETSELKTLNQTSELNYEVTNNSANYDAEVNVTCVSKEGTEAKYTSIKNKLENDATKVLAKSSVNGTLTITLDKTSTESVTEKYTCSLEFTATERDELGKAPNVFETDSWSTIAANVKAGNTGKYSIGDTKSVDLGEFGTHIVRIANKSECTTETSETACGFVVEFADIILKYNMNSSTTDNPYGTNVGGWPASEGRTYINSTIFNALPSDLQNVIVETKVISSHGLNDSSNFISTDKLYLLSAHEVYEDGTSNYISNIDTAYNTTKQLDYYKNQGVTWNTYEGAIKKYNGSNEGWWLRSADITYEISFLNVSGLSNFGGCWGSDFAYHSNGISPAFRIA